MVKLHAILYFSVFWVHYCETAKGNGDYETLQFTLPDTVDELGIKCSRFSSFYCLYGYVYGFKYGRRTLQPTDLQTVKAVLRTDQFWKKINWFDFREKSSDCCGSQMMQYDMYARNSVSPFMFFELITNFDSSPKKLNKVKVRKLFGSILCCPPPPKCFLRPSYKLYVVI
ncbi:uncharacterized protein LOC142335848 [Convolutriloba macropyga]|uniref:uncharacterized protein LOC142335848 n=1 Tax=Convolutriloba macropyga TaxID=536237 RepID=UPI003F524266